MKIIGMTMPYRKFTLERALHGLSGSGYRYIGLGLSLQDLKVTAAGVSDEEVERIKGLCEAYGVSPVLWVSPVKAVDEGSVEAYRKFLDSAAKLGISYVVDFGIKGFKKFPTERFTEEEMAEPHARCVAALRKIAPYAMERGVTILLKPHTGNTRTAEVLLRTIDEIASPAVQAFYDPGNVRYYEAVEPREDVRWIRGDMPLLCAKDHRGPQGADDFPLPGEGEAGFETIFAHLKGVGFQGDVTVERIDGADKLGDLSAEEIDGRMKQARENIIRLASAAGFDTFE